MRLAHRIAALFVLIHIPQVCVADNPPPFTPEQLIYINQLLDVQQQKFDQRLTAQQEKLRLEIVALQAKLKKAGEPHDAPEAIVAEVAPPDDGKPIRSQTALYDVGPNAIPSTAPHASVESAAVAPAFDITALSLAPPAALVGSAAFAPFGYGLQAAKSGVEIHSSTGGSDAKLQLALGDWTITATAPIDDEDNKRANFATLDGLSTGLSFDVSWKRTWSAKKTGAASKLTDATGICGRVPYCTTDTIATALSAPGSDAFSKDAWKAFADKNYTWGKAVDIHAGILRKSFDYYNPAFEKTSEVDMGWTAGGSAGITSSARDQLYAIGFDFEKGYKAAKTRVVCPDGSVSPIECLQGQFGPPSNAIARLLWLETRNSLLHFPFSIRLTRDLAEKETGIDIPIYLVRNDAHDFNGGLRMGWTSSEHFQAGIFVGTDFNIPK